jgi:glycogen(starch) synthase
MHVICPVGKTMYSNHPKVLFLSALKPIDDSRMFEKLALALIDLPLELHVAGQWVSNPVSQPAIRFHSFSGGGRLHVLQSAFSLIWNLKPQLVVACSPDIFLLAAMLKSQFHFQLVYDIQENYALNYKHLYANSAIKGWLARFLFYRSLQVAHLKAAAVLLAEEVYVAQLQLRGPKILVLENKMSAWAHNTMKEDSLSQPDPHRLELLFSGTVSTMHGVFDAIDFAEQCHAIFPTRLIIAGFSPQQAEREKLWRYLENKPFVQTIGIDSLVPHQVVLQAIHDAHAGLIFYHENAAFAGKKPTKFFEYLGLNKWILTKQAVQFDLPQVGQVVEAKKPESLDMAFIQKLLQTPTQAKPDSYLFDGNAFRNLITELMASGFRQE